MAQWYRLKKKEPVNALPSSNISMTTRSCSINPISETTDLIGVDATSQYIDLMLSENFLANRL